MYLNVINSALYWLGQAIPAGLHVRLNMKTGKREAKLLDQDRSSTELIATENGTVFIVRNTVYSHYLYSVVSPFFAAHTLCCMRFIIECLNETFSFN